MEKSHNKVCTTAGAGKQKDVLTALPPPTKVRPLRVAAWRQRELLVNLIENGDLEWIDEDDAEIDAVTLSQKTKEQPTASVTSVAAHMTTPWEDE